MESRYLCRSISFLLTLVAAVATLANMAPAQTTKVIYSFTGTTDGGYPDSDLIMDVAGNLYGSAVADGKFGGGAVFQLTPSLGGWKQSVLYNFTGGPDGGEPYGGVTLDAHGNLYGAAVIGGTGGVCAGQGCGVVYKLTNSGGTWTQSVLYNFTGGNDGSGPGAGVTFDKNGNLYGMTPTGGEKGLGVIYQLKPTNNGSWSFRVIHTFTGGSDGATGSAGRLTLDASGNLFGVATVGGTYGAGTAFELTPSATGKWVFHTLYAFKGQPDAGFPYSALTFDRSGNLYGTTYYAGANGVGAVYSLTQNGGTWNETVLYSFQVGTDGVNPLGNLVYTATGALYGTTSEGGSAGCSCGSIFKLTPAGNGAWNESVVHSFQGPPDGGFAYNGMVPDPKGNLYGTTVHGGKSNEGAVYRFKP